MPKKPMSAPMAIDRLDHIVLTVKSIHATCQFYARVLGMEIRTFGDNRKALAFGSQKINLHEFGREVDPKAHRPTPGSADLCFLATISIKDVIEHLNQCGVQILAGPIKRMGAQGPIESVYFRDPDLNLIEVSNYTKGK